MTTNKLYVNFNFFRVRCNNCKGDLIATINLKNLAEQIAYECRELTTEQNSKHLVYKFTCKICGHVVKCALSVERKGDILFIE